MNDVNNVVHRAHVSFGQHQTTVGLWEQDWKANGQVNALANHFKNFCEFF